MILPAMRGALEVFAVRHRQPGVEIIVLPPRHVVTIELIFLNAQRGGFIGVVSETLRGQHDFIEPAAVSVFRVYGEKAAQETDAIVVIHIAAIFAIVAADGSVSVTELPGLNDIVVTGILAAQRANLFVGGRRHCLLGDQCNRNEEERKGFHRRKVGSLFEP